MGEADALYAAVDELEGWVRQCMYLNRRITATTTIDQAGKLPDHLMHIEMKFGSFTGHPEVKGAVYWLLYLKGTGYAYEGRSLPGAVDAAREAVFKALGELRALANACGRGEPPVDPVFTSESCDATVTADGDS